MKSSTRIILIIMMIISVSSAQENVRLGLSSGPSYSNNIGLSTDLNITFAVYKNIGINISFENYIVKGYKRELSIIPTIYYQLNKLPIYFEGGVGYKHSPEITEVENTIVDGNEITNISKSGGYGATLKIGGGLYIPISRNIHLDLNITAIHPRSNYERIGFGLGLKYIL